MKTQILYLMCVLIVIFSSHAQAKIIYVDDDANGVNNGSSWQNAYTFLQDALADANSAEKPVEIRVAQGIYKPDRGANQTAGDRKANFQLIDEITISGGYAGITETDPNQQDIEKYETILSGDLAGNDADSDYPLISDINKRENSMQIVTNKNTAILIGLTITEGYDYLSRQLLYGGGIYNLNGELYLKDCIIRKNSSYGGGGLYNYQGSIDMMNCIIRENSSYIGGGLYNYQGSIVMTNCIFENNSSDSGGGFYNYLGSFNLCNCIFNMNYSTREDRGSGGGIYNFAFSDSPDLNEQILVNCTFTGNSSYCGGGIFNEYVSPLINNCKFIGNIAFYSGGGIYNKLSKDNEYIILNNCYLCGNSALRDGGGIYYFSGTDVRRNMILNNCLIYGNKAGNLGGGILCRGDYFISNSIIWMNTALNGNQAALLIVGKYSCSKISVQYSNFQGGDLGIYKEFENCEVEWEKGNIDANPLFANSGYWDPNHTPDDTNDDFWVDGDYHLKSQAGRFDPNTQTWVEDSETSPCIDAGDPNSPIGYEPFPNGGRINMGAYGGTEQASKTYFGKPVCTTIVAGDINGDCKVDVLDLEIMMSHWLEEH